MSKTEDLEQAFAFDAFISYRHADLDSAVAGYLQKALEHYRVPREIQKKCGKQNLKRIFRDEEELGASSDLFREIERELKRSEFLLVICTPRLPESKWCLRELETFIRYRGRDNVLAVLAEGEPETSFPALLTEEGEPLAVDIRGKSKREVLRHARERMPRLVAPLLHCSYDELYQRHRVYRMRRMLAAAGVVTAVSVSFGAVAVRQNLEITKNYRGKLENQSRYLAALSGDLLEAGDRDASLLVALEALPKSEEDTSRPYVADARIALENALYTYARDYIYTFRPEKKLEHEGLLERRFDYNEEENVILTFTTDGQAYVREAEGLELVFCKGAEDGQKALDARLAGKQRLLLQTGTGISCVNYRTGETLWKWEFPSCPEPSCIMDTSFIWDYNAESDTVFCAARPVVHYPDGKAVITDCHQFQLIDAATGKSRVWELPGELQEKILEGEYIFQRKICFSPDGQRMAVRWGEGTASDGASRLRIYQTGESEPILDMDYPGNAALDDVIWLPDGDLAVMETLQETSAGLLGGTFGKPLSWRLTCWDMKKLEPAFSYEDTSLALMKRVLIQTGKPGSGADEILTVIFDNVAVNLDRHTGKRYSRIEDRSGIILSHIWEDTSLQLLVTTDGYVFVTDPLSDLVWNPRLDAYHYRLGLGYLPQAKWFGDNLLLYTETEAYCYTGFVDRSYTLLDKAPRDYWYNKDHSLLLLYDYDSNLNLYETEGFEKLWQEPAANSGGSSCPAVLVDDDRAAWLSQDGTALIFRSLKGEERVQLPIEGFENAGAFGLSPGGRGRALIWNGKEVRCSKDPKTIYDSDKEMLESAAVWLADAENGSITVWSYADLMEGLPIPMEDRMNAWKFSPKQARVTASGRYLLIPGVYSDAYDSEEKYEETVLLVWDLKEGQWLALPPELCRHLTLELSYDAFFDSDGWVAPEGDRVVLGSSKELIVADIAEAKELCRWETEGIGSREVSFTPEGNHIVFQDSGLHFKVYDWKEGRYTTSFITPETGALNFSFSADGEYLSAAVRPGTFTSEFVCLYRRLKEGEYRRETSMDHCISCDGSTVLISQGDLSCLYHYYHLDALIAKAREILNGRELTQEERTNYLID